MAAHALKRFRIREVISATAPPPQIQSSTKAKPTQPLQAPQQPFQFQYPFQFQAPFAASDSSATVAESPPQSHVSTTLRHVPRRKNPFVPQLNAKTGKWAPPKYSLRQQADLIKKARKTGLLDLLPPSVKTNKARESVAVVQAARLIVEVHSEPPAKKPVDLWWQKPVGWVGKVKERKVAGADIGNRLYAGRKRMFKGHKWERVAEKRAIRRKMLLRDMPKRITRFKQVGRLLACSQDSVCIHGATVLPEATTAPAQDECVQERKTSVLDAWRNDVMATESVRSRGLHRAVLEGYAARIYTSVLSLRFAGTPLAASLAIRLNFIH